MTNAYPDLPPPPPLLTTPAAKGEASSPPSLAAPGQRLEQTPSTRPREADARTLDQAEVDRFGAMAESWWDPEGAFKPLHQIGPARLAFIRDTLTGHFSSPANAAPPRSSGATALRPLAGLSVIDVGCGGGLIAEPLARMGARVTAIDPAPDTITAARQHADDQGLTIDYRACASETMVAEGATFDAVVCLEVIEHVEDPAAFVAMLTPLVRPGGLLVMSTINRTLRAYALAIIGAEYVLRWLPAGTHRWDRFVTPDELRRYGFEAGLRPKREAGLTYDPLADRWRVSDDCAVNYILALQRPATTLDEPEHAP
ncbi:MAG: bifunctional 2-polyprenyl-6-hydroxyphenol methylase/3-demethylubiquinol 3-O-methyltransferase UbiG [Pseudomonadota bacterium]